MENTTNIVDFQSLKDQLGQDFQPIQVMNGQGELVQPAIAQQYDNQELVKFMRLMVWERTLHLRANALTRQGRLGFYAPTAGQEASEMGSQAAMKEQDVLMPAYRDLPQLIQHGLPLAKAFLWSRGHVLGNQYPDSLHAMPPQIIIGAQYIQAAGVGLGIKKNQTADKIVYAYTGDGGTSQGDFYEGINFAGAFQVPAVFIVQNNGYAISVPRRRQTEAKTLAQKAVAAGIPSVQVDGMDFLAVNAVTKAARDFAVAGHGPVLIETLTYRFGPHTNAGDDPKRYRSKEEEQPWLDNDPLIRMRTYLTKQGLWSEDQENEYIAEVKEQVKSAIAEADAAPKQKMTDYLKNTFANQPQNIQDQLVKYSAKESK